MVVPGATEAGVVAPPDGQEAWRGQGAASRQEAGRQRRNGLPTGEEKEKEKARIREATGRAGARRRRKGRLVVNSGAPSDIKRGTRGSVRWLGLGWAAR